MQKAPKLRVLIDKNQGQKRKKIEVLGSIMGKIKSNLKREDWNELWPKT